MSDRIIIKSLEAFARIGVPDEERSRPQRLEMDLLLETDFRGIGDEVSRTTDYAVVADWVNAECARSECRLIETLAENLAGGVLLAFPLVQAVDLEIRKFILPHTRHVAVRLRRERH
jgi:dihydroneopterin aldolase